MLGVVPLEKDRGWRHVRGRNEKTTWQCKYCHATVDCFPDSNPQPSDWDHDDDCPMKMWAFLQAIESRMHLED